VDELGCGAGMSCTMPCSRAHSEREFVRKLAWVAADAVALGLVIFGWILTSAGFFHFSNEEKLGPETTFAPTRGES
jgi:hypothetical protein